MNKFEIVNIIIGCLLDGMFGLILYYIIDVINKNREIDKLKSNLKGTNDLLLLTQKSVDIFTRDTVPAKYKLKQTVYIYHNNKMYKDEIIGIKIISKGRFYTTHILRDIPEDEIFKTFDDLCIKAEINKDDLLMYSFNNEVDRVNKKWV